MTKPEPVIETDEHTGEYEEWVGELDDWETAEITSIDKVREDAQQGEPEGKSVEEPQQDMDGYDCVNKSAEEATSYYCMFFHQL